LARIIELCGAPGVGKSTVYKEINNQWKKSCNWIPAHKLYQTKNPSSSYLKKIHSFFFKTEIIGEREMRKAGKRFIETYPDYIESCWKHITLKEKSSINNTDQRFEKAGHVFKMVQKIQICRESNFKDIAIIEEGLINGIGNALYEYNNRVEMLNEIALLYKKMPLPSALVFFEADINTIIERINNRNRFIPFLEGLNSDDLFTSLRQIQELRKTAAKEFENQGYPVLFINADIPAANSAITIINYINNLKIT
jgi:deoxyadenosine/deoxycytidine kinase